MHVLKNFLTISRANIQIASLPTATIGAALTADSWDDILNLPIFLFILLFFIILTYSCNINCVCDVEVDQKHKKYMSSAVKSLKPRSLKKIMTIELLSAGSIILVLCLLKKDIVYTLAVFGILCGFSYSSPPLRIKKRGVLSPLPVVCGLYFLPVIAGGYLVTGKLSLFMILFGVGYALLMQGITFVNMCEDYSEDRIYGIKTVAHVFGIRKTLLLGAVIVATGGILDLILILFFKIDLGAFDPFIHLTVMLICLLFFFTVLRISRRLLTISRAEDPEAACKKYAGKMPVMFLMTRYPLLFIALLLI